MALTLAQKQTLKAYYLANLNTLDDTQARDAFNAIASPDYLVWRTNQTRPEIYNATGDGASAWDWTTYKNQAVGEQNAWREMFSVESLSGVMTCNFGQLNNRSCVSKIFTGSAAANAQRDHVFSVSRRKATLAEKLLAVAVVNPPANTGNNAGQPRGSAANPDVLGFEGSLTTQDVIDSLNS